MGEEEGGVPVFLDLTKKERKGWRMALFDKLKSGLGKTRKNLVGRLRQTLALRPQIDEELFDEIEEVLISSDIGVETALSVLENVRERVKKERIAATDRVQELLRQELKGLLEKHSPGSSDGRFFSPAVKPFVIMVVGVNGTGKTTTIGKLAAQFTRLGKKVLIAAADTFRAAASEQLQVWAERSGSQLVQQKPGADPGAVAFDAASAALARGADVLIVDTAGRLHTKVNLMEELKKVRRVLEKKIPGAPHETLLVLDATVGQNALRQVEEFRRAVGVTGIVLTKLDGTAKGGVVLAVANSFEIPVRFVGIGEKIDDLEPFDPDVFVDALFAE